MPPLPQPQHPTLNAIYAAYEARADRHERTYLGMSQFDTECDRALWYGFHWANEPEHHDGRKLRLFETGHREETRMLDDLRAAGVEIQDSDLVTGEQWEVVALGGHFRGHFDGKAVGFAEAPVTEHLVEIKTHNEKSFKALVKDGVEKSKPGHFAQMQLYMHFGGLTRAFYLAHNKNTDELCSERVNYDPIAAARLVVRAQAIIRAARPPARLHADPKAKAAYACGWCPALAICHEGAWARRNCRTCLHSTPEPDGTWSCSWNPEELVKLPVDMQRKGCPLHLFIPDLVPGEQFDAGEGVVLYRMPAGETWIDGVAA